MIIEILTIVAAVASLVALIGSMRVHVAVRRAERADAMVSGLAREESIHMKVAPGARVRAGELVALVPGGIASYLEAASPMCVCGHRAHEHMMDDGPCGNLRGGPCGCFRFSKIG